MTNDADARAAYNDRLGARINEHLRPHSEDTVALVAQVLRDNRGCFDEMIAARVLDALAERGLLLPEGTEQRTEWGVWWLGPGDGIRLTKEHLTSREEAEQTAAVHVGEYGIVRWELRRREHRLFADGSCWSGPWSPIPPGPEEPTDA